ncbi:hypothetical protein Csa_000043 [Cucumis sativus]|uniref:Uncharacterized protein n=2 Tax=Cucumis sativus TaxID=3659 RepID=A0A0A0KK38_CUCSA|nr:hypothetical protein Csa_000043 [Cucumis sativus]
MFRGKSMGGGPAGNIIRTAGRAVARAANTPTNRPSSPTSTSRATRRPGGSANFHGLSSSTSLSQYPVSTTNGVPAGWHFCNPYCDEFEWVTEDGIEIENGARVYEDSMEWSVPTLDEVHGAVSAIHEVFGQEENDEAGQARKYTGLVNRISPVGSDVDWIEPCLEMRLGGFGVERVYDAFHLLQTDPSVQKMVMSVSSDKAVWEAIMNNEAVQHLRNSFHEAKDEVRQNLEETSPDKHSENESTNIVRWIFDNTKTRVMEVIERITELMNHLFHSGNENDDKKRSGEGMNVLEEKLRTSFLISIVVLLVVMVTRAHKTSSS